MSLYLLIIMAFFLGGSWLLRMALSDSFSERVAERSEGPAKPVNYNVTSP